MDLLLSFSSVSCCAMTLFPSSLFLLQPHKKASPEQNCVALSFSGGGDGKHKGRRNSSFSIYQRRGRATWEFSPTWWSEKLPTEWISFCTEQKVCATTRSTTIFVSWYDDDTKSTQTIPLGGCVEPQELISRIHCREELLLMAEQKVSKLQNCFYYNIAQKQKHQNKSLFLQNHVASLRDGIFCPGLIQMTLNDTWCGASV